MMIAFVKHILVWLGLGLPGIPKTPRLGRVNPIRGSGGRASEAPPPVFQLSFLNQKSTFSFQISFFNRGSQFQKENTLKKTFCSK